MKAWRRSGGLGRAGAAPVVEDFLISPSGGETLDGSWTLGPPDPDSFTVEIRYNGGPWNVASAGIPGADRLANFDAAGHITELAQCRIQAVVGGAGGEWTESNAVIVL